MPDKIEQIFQIVVQGLDKAVEQLNSLTAQINEAADAKNRLNKLLSVAQDSGDKKSIDDLTARIKELNIEEEKLKNQHSALTKETNVLLSVRKSLASATEDQAKKSKLSSDQTLDEITKIKSLTQQINELRIARGLATKQSEITGIPASVSIDNNTLTLKESNELEEKLLATRNKSLEILAGIESVAGRTNTELRGSLTLYEQERNALTQILENKRQALQADDPKRYTEIVNRVKELNLLIQQEKVSIDEVTAKISTQTAEYKIIVAQRQQLENIIANSKDDSVTFAGKTVSLQTSNQLLDTLKIKEESYKQSLIGESAILKEMVGSKQLIILTEDKLLTAQQKELSQLSAIEKANISKSDIILEKRLVTYEQLVSRISELRSAEQKQINDEAALRNNIDLTTSSLERLQAEQQKVISVIKQLDEASVNRTGQANVSLPSPIGGGRVNLEQALQLQQSIGSQIEKQKSDLVILRQEEVLLNAQKEKEYQLSIANLTTEENSVAALTKRKNELSSLISKREEEKNVTSGTPIGFEKDLLTLEQARNKLVEINDQLVKAEQGAKGIEFLKQVSQLNALKANIDQLNASIIASANSTNKLVDFNGIFIPLDVAKARLAGMEGEFDKISNKLQIWNEEQKAINVSEEESINKLRQERIEIETILRNRASGATTVNVQSLGGEVSIDHAIARRNEIKIREDEWTQSIKLRQLSMEAALPSLQGMEASVQLLTEVLFKLNGQLSNSQWAEYRAILSSVVPEVNQFTTEQINAGNGTQLFKDKIASLNLTLLENKREISGRSTTFGDYTKGIVDAFKTLGNTTDIFPKLKASLDTELSQNFAKIQELIILYNALKEKGGDAFEKIKIELDAAGKKHVDLENRVKSLKEEFAKTATVGSSMSTAIASGFDRIGRQILATTAIYFGFQAAISGVSRLIAVDKKLSDQFADLQRTLQATTKETKGVIDSLKELDTRTSLTELSGLAIIAARAGVATNNIAGVTSAINKLQLVAGQELGDIETATTSIIKLINIFQGAGAVTEESVLRMGNAIVTLTNEGVASGKFLVNFAERLAGIQGATKIGEAAVFGLAAAFEETGQQAEVAASATAQVINRISLDVPKFAALAETSTESFRKVLQQNPAEAIIQLAESLVKEGDTIDEIGAKFDKLGLTGVRIKTTLQDVGANAEFFRKRISDATVALVNQNVIMDGSARKQETFAATLDKIGASLQKAFDNETFVNLLDSIGRAVLGFIRLVSLIPFQAVLLSITGLTAAFALYKGQVIATALTEALANKQSALNIVARIAEKLGLISLTQAQRLKLIQDEAELVIAKENAIQKLILTGITRAEAEATVTATLAQEGLNDAMAISPIGIFLALLATALPILGAYASKTEEATAKVTEQSKAIRTNADIQRRIGEIIEEESGKTKNAVQALISIMRDETLSLGARKLAYDQLIHIAPEFTGTVNDTTDALGQERLEIKDLMGVYDDFIAKIDQLARAKATAAVGEKLQADLVSKELDEERAKQQKQAEDIENAAVRARNRAKLQAAGIDENAQPIPGQRKVIPVGVELEKEVHAENESLEKATAETKKQQELVNTFNGLRKKEVDDLVNKQNEVKVQLLHAVEGSKEQAALVKKRDELEEAINAALGKVPPPPGTAKESGALLDDLKDQLKLKKEEIVDQDKLIDQFEEQKKKEGKLTDLQQVGFNEAIKKLKILRAQKTEIEKRIRELGGKTSGGSTAITSFIDQNSLKEIEAQRDLELTIEKTAFAKLSLQHKASFDEQRHYLADLFFINKKFNEERVEQLENNLELVQGIEVNATGKRKQQLLKDEAELQLLIAKTRLDNANGEIQSNEEIQRFRDQEFRKDLDIEKNRFEQRRSLIQLEVERLKNIQGIEVPATIIAEAQKKSDDELLEEIRKTYAKRIFLAQTFKQDTRVIEEEGQKAVNDQIKKGLDYESQIYEAHFTDIETVAKNSMIAQGALFAKYASDIFEHTANIRRALSRVDVLDDQKKIVDATIEEAKAARNLQEARKQYDAHRITIEKLQEAEANYVTAHRSFLKAITEKIGLLDNLKDGAEGLANALANDLGLNSDWTKTLVAGFGLAQDAMSQFFEVERNNIERSKNAQEERIQTEFDIRKARAQSQAESESLDREALAEKKKIDHEAGEQLKKVKKSEAAIALATELANIAASAAGNILNGITFGAAGIIQYGILSAIAFARYAFTTASIESATFALGGWIRQIFEFGGVVSKVFSKGGIIKESNTTISERVNNYYTKLVEFAYGGIPDMQTTRGGKVKGRSHSDGGNQFIFKGRIFEDEIDELNIIRTRNAPRGKRYKVEGTQEEIASAMNVVGGGINFRPGWKIEKFQTGGFLNSGSPSFTLQAPVASDTTPSRDSKANEELRKLIVDIVGEVKKLKDSVGQVSQDVNSVSKQTNNRIDKIQVINNATETVRVDKDRKKVINMGSINK